MSRLLLLGLLCAVSLPASAIYKCKTGNQITYSDTECVNGTALKTGGTFSTEAARDAQQRLEADQAELNRLRNARKREEASQERAQEQYARAAASQRKKCALLEQRQRWAEEDVAHAGRKAQEGAQRKVRRAAEKFSLECGK